MSKWKCSGNHVSENNKAVALPDFFQRFEEQVATIGVAQKRKAAVTTAGDEVQIVGFVVTFEALRHEGILRQL
jgi:hypothetical protein